MSRAPRLIATPGRCARRPLFRFALLLLLWLHAGLAAAQPQAAGDAGRETAANEAAEENPDRSGSDTVGAAAKPVSEEAIEREQSADEDPMSRRHSQKVDQPHIWEALTTGIEGYTSIRVRTRSENGGDFIVSDGGTRGGLAGQWKLRRETWLLGRAEVGFNVLNEAGFLFDPGSRPPDTRFGDTAFLRLLYVGLEAPDFVLTYGKNWSTYYKIASYTDRFVGTGARASGAFNALTDGGASGTGRADNVLQTRADVDFLPDYLGIKPFSLNIQFQHGEEIAQVPGETYGTGVGLSAILQTETEHTIGVAYNFARVRDPDSSAVRRAGIDGNDQALLLGLRSFGDRWYAATVVSRLLNHEVTDELVYFDGWGWEFYSQYEMRPRLWVIGGWNWLRPDRSQVQAGDYQIKYGVLGLRYSFDDFRRMIYFNAQLEGSRNADGTLVGNSYTIGVRWDFSTTDLGW